MNIKKTLSVIIIISAILIALVIIFSSHIATYSITKYLHSQGLDVNEIKISYPDKNSLVIEKIIGDFNNNNANFLISGNNIKLPYSLILPDFLTKLTQNNKSDTITAGQLELKILTFEAGKETEVQLQKKIISVTSQTLSGIIISHSTISNWINDTSRDFESTKINLNKFDILLDNKIKLNGSLALENNVLSGKIDVANLKNENAKKRTFKIESKTDYQAKFTLNINEKDSEYPLINLEHSVNNNQDILEVLSYPMEACSEISEYTSNNDKYCINNPSIKINSKISENNTQNVNLDIEFQDYYGSASLLLLQNQDNKLQILKGSKIVFQKNKEKPHPAINLTTTDDIILSASKENQIENLNFQLGEIIIEEDGTLFRTEAGKLNLNLTDKNSDLFVINLPSPNFKSEELSIGMNEIVMRGKVSEDKLISDIQVSENSNQKIVSKLITDLSTFNSQITLNFELDKFPLRSSPIRKKQTGMYIKNESIQSENLTIKGKIELKLDDSFSTEVKTADIELNGDGDREKDDKKTYLFLSDFKSETKFTNKTDSELHFETSLNIPGLAAPIPVSNISGLIHSKYNFKKQEILSALDNAEGRILGGEIKAKSDRIYPLNDPSKVLVELDNILLEEIFALYPDTIEGSGKIYGELPLTISTEGISITNGLLKNKDNGIIRYGGKTLSSGKADGINLVVQALENYHYNKLEGDVDYGLDGTLNLALRLEGRNPQLMDGRMFHFNLNIEENIPALIKSLTIGDRIVKELSKPYMRK